MVTSELSLHGLTLRNHFPDFPDFPLSAAGPLLTTADYSSTEPVRIIPQIGEGACLRQVSGFFVFETGFLFVALAGLAGLELGDLLASDC